VDDRLGRKVLKRRTDFEGQRKELFHWQPAVLSQQRGEARAFEVLEHHMGTRPVENRIEASKENGVIQAS